MDADGLWYLRGRLVEALARRDWTTVEHLWDAYCADSATKIFFGDLIFLYTGRHWVRGERGVGGRLPVGAWPV